MDSLCRHRRGAFVTIRNANRHNTIEYNLKYKLTKTKKTKKQLAAHGDCSNTSNCLTKKVPRYFEEFFKFFKIFRSSFIHSTFTA